MFILYDDLHFYVVLLVIMTNFGKILLLKMLILEILLLKMMDKLQKLLKMSMLEMLLLEMLQFRDKVLSMLLQMK